VFLLIIYLHQTSCKFALSLSAYTEHMVISIWRSVRRSWRNRSFILHYTYLYSHSLRWDIITLILFGIAHIIIAISLVPWSHVRRWLLLNFVKLDLSVVSSLNRCFHRWGLMKLFVASSTLEGARAIVFFVTVHLTRAWTLRLLGCYWRSRRLAPYIWLQLGLHICCFSHFLGLLQLSFFFFKHQLPSLFCSLFFNCLMK